MPIFEYKCSDCGKQFETLVRSGTQPVCPACGGSYLAKQLSVFAPGVSGSSSGSAAQQSDSQVGACGHVCGSGCSLH